MKSFLYLFFLKIACGIAGSLRITIRNTFSVSRTTFLLHQTICLLLRILFLLHRLQHRPLPLHRYHFANSKLLSHLTFHSAPFFRIIGSCWIPLFVCISFQATKSRFRHKASLDRRLLVFSLIFFYNTGKYRPSHAFFFMSSSNACSAFLRFSGKEIFSLFKFSFRLRSSSISGSED